MSLNIDHIKKVGERVRHYPHTKPEHYRVTKLSPGTDGKFVEYEAEIHETEYELWQHLTSLKKKLSEREMTRLKTLISNYGDHRYNEGAFDESYEG